MAAKKKSLEIIKRIFQEKGLILMIFQWKPEFHYFRIKHLTIKKVTWNLLALRK